MGFLLESKEERRTIALVTDLCGNNTEQVAEEPPCLFNTPTVVKTTKAAAKSTNKKKTRSQKNAFMDTKLS